MLGADTRATGELVVDKNCAKLHYIAPNIYCAGAGTAADCVMVTESISSQLELLRLNTGAPQSRVVTALTIAKRYLFQNQGQIGAALVLGGVDVTGGFLHSVHPHGSSDSLSFTAMGSGSLAAMSVLESGYKDELTEEEAMSMVCNAILAGVFNDLGSGSNVDLVIIRKSDTTYLRNYKTPNDVGLLRGTVRLPVTAFNFPKGSTPFYKETVEIFAKPETNMGASATGEAMELVG